jgi:peptidoglycan-associated lipoprotein
MMQSTTRAKQFAVVGLLMTGLSLTGCYAKKKDVREEFARVRTEMQTADQQLTAKTTELADGQTRQGTRLDALEADVQKMRTELSDLNVKVTRLNGLISFDVPVHFDFDQANLRDADKAVLKQFAAVVKEFYPGAVLTAEGFTDPAGSPGYNMRLGQKRAETVRDFLTSDGGFSAEQIRAASYGESKNRLITNEGGPGEKGMQNRRVVLVLDFVASALNHAPPRVTTDN